MRRREFILHTATGLGAWLGAKGLSALPLPLPSLPTRFNAADTVILGKTGIKTSRLAMGTGTAGVGHRSHQTALGIQGLSGLLLNGYDRGLRFFDSADSYGSHPHVAEARVERGDDHRDRQRDREHECKLFGGPPSAGSS